MLWLTSSATKTGASFRSDQIGTSNQFQLGCISVDDLLTALAQRKELISDMDMGW